MSETLVDKIGNEEILALAGMLVGVIAILCGMVVAITIVITTSHRWAHVSEMEATLKMEMIQRGMSADDIRKVLESHLSQGNRLNLYELLKPPAPAFGQQRAGSANT